MRGIEEKRETFRVTKSFALPYSVHVFLDSLCQFLHFIVWNVQDPIFNL